MVKSRSGRKIMECDICNKSKSSHARGKYWLQIINDMLLLTCCSCKKGNLFKVSFPENIITRKALLFCCFNNTVFKVIETDKLIIAECFRCGTKTFFKKVI